MQTIRRDVQLRLFEPGDAELLAMIHAEVNAPTDRAYYAATDAIKALLRTLDQAALKRAVLRMSRLRQQTRAERKAVA